MAQLLMVLTSLLVLTLLPPALSATCPPTLLWGKCNCSTTIPGPGSVVSCAGLTRSDWLAIAGLPEPVWTGLLVADSPELGPSLDLGELSQGWRDRLDSLAIRTSDLRAVTLAAGVRLPRLAGLDLSANRLANLGDAVWQLGGGAGNASAAPELRNLLLSGNPFTELDGGASHLLRFQRLGLLDFSGCQELRRVTFEFTDALAGLSRLRQLRFNGCRSLQAWAWGPALRRLEAGGAIGIKDTPAWNCSCEAAWLARLPASALGARCALPTRLSGQPLSRVNFTREFGCRRPQFDDFSGRARYGVGDTARLLCRVSAEPPATITWATNRGDNVTFVPALRHLYVTPADTLANTFHSDHAWHWDSQYDASKSHEGTASGRIQVLQDASLYIDYVTRADAGAYTCHADNGLGPEPQSKQLQFTLRYEVLREVKKYGMIVGAACAASLLGIGFVIGLIRLVVRKCSEEEREKKKSIREMLEHLESYREAKMGQFKEYWQKSHGGSQVDSYNTRVSKMKEICIANMTHMQESYNRRIAKVRDHCDSQIERLRESYNSQMGRIKDYRSSQVERVREQYNQRLLRIKDYAAGQLERLRDQYKAQQAYFIRMLESVSLDNCVSSGADVEELEDLDIGDLELTSDSEEPAAAGGTSGDEADAPRPESHRLRRLRKRRRPRQRELAAAAAAFAIDEEESLEDFVSDDPALSGTGPSEQVSTDEDGTAECSTPLRRVTTLQVEVMPHPHPPPLPDADGGGAGEEVS